MCPAGFSLAAKKRRHRGSHSRDYRLQSSAGFGRGCLRIMAMNIYEQFGIQRIINARSFSTKLGGTRLPDEVLEAMRQAAQCCVRMDELQDAASRVIAEATGAEAGIVTSGASAALTLATAACLAGFDVSRMNRLPDTAGIPCEVVVHRSHRNDYDHALRAAGARFVEVGFSYYTFPYEVEQAITENTAALYYQAGGDGACDAVVRLRRHRPPAGNL